MAIVMDELNLSTYIPIEGQEKDPIPSVCQSVGMLQNLEIPEPRAMFNTCSLRTAFYFSTAALSFSIVPLMVIPPLYYAVFITTLFNISLFLSTYAVFAGLTSTLKRYDPLEFIMWLGAMGTVLYRTLYTALMQTNFPEFQNLLLYCFFVTIIGLYRAWLIRRITVWFECIQLNSMLSQFKTIPIEA